MKQQTITSQQQLGARVAEARRVAGLTQDQLASRLGLDRSALSRVESGDRKLDALELMALSRELGFPLGWFLCPPSEAVLSQRGGEGASGSELRAEAVMGELARDVGFLHELSVLKAQRPIRVERNIDLQRTEEAALHVRRELGYPHEPLHDLPRFAEEVGLFSVVEDRGRDLPEGMYHDLGEIGVAWISGHVEMGRRRFTLAHELGHHVFEDEYRVDWKADNLEGERLINAFAIHLLLPRQGVRQRWRGLIKEGLDTRSKAIVIAAEYGVSWSAACAQLERLELLSQQEYSALISCPPRRGDYLALEAKCPDDLPVPSLSPRLSAAVLRAFRSNRITASRAVELLRGTLAEDELPEPHPIPPEAYSSDFSPSE